MHRTFLRRALGHRGRLFATSFAGLSASPCSRQRGRSRRALRAPRPAVNLSGVTLNVADQTEGVPDSLPAAGVANTPYKISWSNFIGGPPIIAAESGGSVDLGSMAETPTIFASRRVTRSRSSR